MTSSSPPSIPEAFLGLADIARTLGHAHRLALLEHLAQGEQPVERLAELSGLSIANTSQHLQHLKRAGMVLAQRDGKHVRYRLGVGPISQLLAALHDYLAHRHAEIQQVLSDSRGQRQRLESISLHELLQRMQMEDTVLLDVRSGAEFVQGHLPGAVNIPVDELESRLTELPPDQNVVAYCRGPYCVLSVQAVTALRATGRTTHRFEAGIAGWKEAGLRIDVPITARPRRRQGTRQPARTRV